MTHDGDFAYQLANNPSKLRGREWDASDTFRPCDLHWKEEPSNLKHQRRAGITEHTLVRLFNLTWELTTLHIRTTTGPLLTFLSALLCLIPLLKHMISKKKLHIDIRVLDKACIKPLD
jgi:hypothetical protein